MKVNQGRLLYVSPYLIISSPAIKETFSGRDTAVQRGDERGDRADERSERVERRVSVVPPAGTSRLGPVHGAHIPSVVLPWGDCSGGTGGHNTPSIR